MPPTLNQLLKSMVEQGGSDLHVTTNSPPQVRVDGHLKPLSLPPLTPTETKQLAYSILTDNQKHRLEENLEIDLSFGIKGLARFRANIFHQRGAIAAVFRQIPYEIKGFRELGLPAQGLLLSLFGFNAGVELGQALVVAVALPALVALRRTSYERRVIWSSSMAILVVGLALFVERMFL